MLANASHTINDENRLHAAKFAHELAQTHCLQGQNSRSCAWYHGSWQFLRMLDLVSTPAAHAAHYESQLAAISKDPDFRNILISGSADFSMVKTINDSLSHRGKEIRMTVADICATPLKVCEHYAEEAGIKITSLKQDILEGVPSAAFDAIFTHSFMGYFDDSTRPALIRQWARALRKGGRLVTVQRVRDNYPEDTVRFDAAEIESFVARADSMMQEHRGTALADFDIVTMARTFAHNFRNFPVRSASQLRAMLEDEGFELTLFEQKNTVGTEGVTGPSVPNSTGFYLIVAERI